MKKIVCAAFAAAFAATSIAPAIAQPDRDRGGDPAYRGGDRADRGGDRGDRGGDRAYRGEDRADRGGDRADQGGFVRHDDWRRGRRMRHEDWDRGQRIDWREHHLRRPPRGYEWREVDGNYVLAAAATGVIANIIANSR